MGIQGGYGDWVGQGEGYTGYYPAAKGGPRYSGAGPGSPCQGWSGWYLGPEYPVGTAPWTHPSGPVGDPAGPSLVQASVSPFWPIRARLRSISWKVSQNGIVSPKSM